MCGTLLDRVLTAVIAIMPNNVDARSGCNSLVNAFFIAPCTLKHSPSVGRSVNIIKL